MVRSFPTAFACLALASATSACFPDYSLPEGAQVRCERADECPSGYRCELGIQRCVPQGATGSAAPKRVGEAVVSPAAISTGTVHVRFVTDVALGGESIVTGATEDGKSLTFTADADATDASQLTWAFKADVSESTPDGDYALSAAVSSLDGTPNTLLLGTLRVDHLPPAAPKFTRFVVRLGRGNPWVPSEVPRLTVHGDDGAFDGAGTLTFFDAEDATEPAATITSLVDGSFPEVTTEWPAWVAFTDSAGNPGPRVALPDIAACNTNLSGPPITASPDAIVAVVPGLTLSFSAAPPGGALGTAASGITGFVRTGGEVHELTANAGPVGPMYQADFPVPANAAEGLGVLVFWADAPLPGGLYAPGSHVLSTPRVVDIDATSPVFATSQFRYGIVNGVRAVSGLAGALFDDVGTVRRIDTSRLCLSIEGVTFFQAQCSLVHEDGSFDPVEVPPVSALGWRLVATDPAGNRATAPLVAETELVAPTVRDVSVEPPIVRHGEPVTVRFSVDDASPIAEVLVLVGGSTATRTSSAPDGGGTRYVYTAATAPPVLPMSTEVLLRVVDNQGNAQLEALPLVIDATPPEVLDLAPGNATSVGAIDVRAGDDTGIERVEWSLERTSDGAGWNGSAFVTGTPPWLVADGLGPLDVQDGLSVVSDFRVPSSVLPAGPEAVRLSVRAHDGAGRMSDVLTRVLNVAAATSTPPAMVTAESTGVQRIRVQWTEPASAADSYRVHFRAAGHTTFDGQSTTLGASPVVVAGSARTLTFTDLPRGTWEFCVSGVRGTESPCGTTVSAASRTWLPLTLAGTGTITSALSVRGRTYYARSQLDPGGEFAYVHEGGGPGRSLFQGSAPVGGSILSMVSPLGPDGVAVVLGDPASGGLTILRFRYGDATEWVDGLAGAVHPTEVQQFISSANGVVAIAPAGDDPLWWSQDAGATWTRRTSVVAPPAGRTILQRVRGDFVVNYSGLTQYRSVDGGVNFVRIVTRDGTPVNSITGIVPSPDRWFGVADGQALQSNDRGLTFAPVDGIPSVNGLGRTRTGTWFSGSSVWYVPDGGVLTERTDLAGRVFLGEVGGVLLFFHPPSGAPDSGFIERCIDDCSVLTRDTGFPGSITAAFPSGRFVPTLDGLVYFDQQHVVEYGPW